MVLILSVSIPASASAWGEVDFEGSGWGHGVGLSQYGAYAMATLGSSYAEILAHYYQGTSIEQVSTSTTLWVNLERDFLGKNLTVLDIGASPGADVVISTDSGSANANPGASISIAIIGVDGCTITITNPLEDPIVLSDATDCAADMSWYSWATGTDVPTTRVQIEGCTLADWNSAPTTWRPCQYAFGTLHLRSGAGGLDLSAEMLIDDYVHGISEMPYYWDDQIEALKSQAVAARSYAEARRIVRGTPGANSCGAWCHVKDTSSDQRYVGWGHSNNVGWLAAVEGTAREVLTHPDSSIGVVTTYYSSSTGGATEFGHEKGFSSGPVEWLSSVDDSWAVDGTVWNPNASWVNTFSADEVAQSLGFDFLTSARVISTRPGSGSVDEVEYWGIKNGDPVGIVKTGSWTRATFGLKSEYFDVDFGLPGDEMFFYRDSGEFRYDNANPDGTLGSPILKGSGYTAGWDSITSVDLDGDGQDEMFFYRDDGLFRYYEIDPNANLGSPISAGNGYTKNWSSITAVDLDGDGQDEMFFYRDDGLFRYYNINPNGTIGSPLNLGDDYPVWDIVTAINLDGF